MGSLRGGGGRQLKQCQINLVLEIYILLNNYKSWCAAYGYQSLDELIPVVSN